MDSIIVSCDKYKDAWDLCKLSLDRFWQDRDGTDILVTETSQSPFGRTINVDTQDWCTRINCALKEIDSDVLFFLLEDQWPIEKVDNAVIDYCYKYMIEHENVGVIYMESSGIGGVKQAQKYDDRFNELPFGAPYRLSCAPALIRKDFLSAVTSEQGSAWDFEKVRSLDPVGEKYTVLELNNTRWVRLGGTGAITKGKWVKEAKKYAEELGYKIDYSIRPELSAGDIWGLKLRSFLFNLNPKMVVRIQNLLK